VGARELVEPVSQFDQTRHRIIEVTRNGLEQLGPRKLSLSDVALRAGISRPTLYRHFASKDALLAALALDDQEIFDANLAVAVKGKRGRARLEAALVYVVLSQDHSPARHLVEFEPTFVLTRLQEALGAITASMTPIFEQLQSAGPSRPSHGVRPQDRAAAVARVALSHILWGSDDPQGFLAELHAAANLR
jgi:AcrR family transcriptional regulator